MKVICSWCGKQQKEKYPLEDERVSHTMCENCLKKQMSKIKEIADGKTERVVNGVRCDTSTVDDHGGDSPVGDVLKQIEETRKFDAHYLEEARKDGFKC